MLINKQFYKYIDDDINQLNNLNNDFYSIKYSQNISNDQSGCYINNLFNQEHFGILSKKKIN